MLNRQSCLLLEAQQGVRSQISMHLESLLYSCLQVTTWSDKLTKRGRARRSRSSLYETDTTTNKKRERKKESVAKGSADMAQQRQAVTKYRPEQ
jgi:hypothetical protein